MSKLRDVLSRNNLKMPDLAGPGELWHGDWLLRADRTLSRRLDGVYRRGESYLRGLQKASSLAFGTRPGRFLTRFVAIPFGGAMILLEGLKHLLDKLYGVEHAAEAVATTATEGAAAVPPPPDVTHILSWFDRFHHPVGFWGGIIVVGLVLMGLIHVRRFRQTVADLAIAGWQILRLALVELPRWLWQFSSLRFLWGSRFARWFRQKVLFPLALTVLLWMIFPMLGLYSPSVTYATLTFIVLAAVLNTRVGRDLEELTTERLHDTWRKLRAHVFLAAFEAVMDFFKRVIETVERVLYAVDEWLRFRSGESTATLLFKGVLALAWSAVAFVVRFALNLLVEPQVNPIKHFPVVTVSHKILLPMIPTLAGALQTVFSLETAVAGTIATAVIFCIPGVFGFLVWECKENWRLYAANRPPQLRPVLVGSHGESVIRLMKPGFHSGTVPKTFAKLRRAERQPPPAAATACGPGTPPGCITRSRKSAASSSAIW
jgi:hypothetical protein